jgi:iron complex transport system ATP-binding protein
MPALEARAITVRLGGSTILHDLTLACRAGRMTGLVGPNGAGKSTLVKALTGLLPLERGTVSLGGRNLADLPAAEKGRTLAYLPQERSVHWPLTARRVVALGRLPHHGLGPPAADALAIDRAMHAMDIDALGNRSIEEISGGELQRVLLARALAQETPVILADEPTAGLDPAHALGLLEIFDRLAAEGRTIVVALHDLSLAARFCHDVVMLADGRIAAMGAPADVLTSAHLEAVFGARMAVGAVGGVPAVVAVSPLVRTIAGRDTTPK